MQNSRFLDYKSVRSEKENVDYIGLTRPVTAICCWKCLATLQKLPAHARLTLGITIGVRPASTSA